MSITNVGIKTNKAYFFENISDGCVVQHNLSKGNLDNPFTNTYVNIQLIKSNFKYPLNISLNCVLKTNNSVFELEYYMNTYFKFIQENDDQLWYRLEDGSTCIFIRDSNVNNKYYCHEIDQYLFKMDNGEKCLDNLNGVRIFYKDKNYPERIEKNGIIIISYEYEYNETKYVLSSISNILGERITLTYTGNNVTEILYSKIGLEENESYRKKVALTYETIDDKKVLKSIEEYHNNDANEFVLIKELELNFGLNLCLINNKTINEYVKLEFTTSTCTCKKNVYGNVYLTTITKSDLYSEIKHNNLIKRVFFNYFFNPIEEIDEYGRIVKKYYNDNNQLIGNTNPLYLDLQTKDNLYKSAGISYDTTKLSAVSGEYDTAMQFIDNKTMEYKIYGVVDDTEASLDIKVSNLEFIYHPNNKNTRYTIRFYFKNFSESLPYILCSYKDKNNNTYTTNSYSFDSEYYQFRYNIFEFVIPHDHTELTFKIVFNGKETSYSIGYVSIDKQKRIKDYIYLEDENKISTIFLSDDEINYEYNNNLITKVSSNNGNELNISYINGKMENIKSGFGKSANVLYNHLDQIKDIILTNRSKNKKIKISKKFLNNTEIIKEEINDRFKSTKYNYTDKYQLLNVEQPIKLKTTFSYDGLGKVNSLLFSNKSNSNYSELIDYNYDNYEKLSDIVKPKENKIQYVYDLDKIKQVNFINDTNSINLIEYEYKKNSDETYIDLITKIKYPTNDNYSFNYNKYGKVTDISYNDEQIAQYTYDVNKNLTLLTDYKNNIKYSYEYVLDNNLYKKSYFNRYNELIHEIDYFYGNNKRILHKNNYATDDEGYFNYAYRDYYNVVNRSNFTSPENFKRKLDNINYLYSCVFLDDNLTLSSKNDKILPYNVVEINKEIYPNLLLDRSNSLIYRINNLSLKNLDLFIGCITKNESDGVVIDLKDVSSNLKFELRITSDYYLEANFYVTPYEHLKSTIKTSKQLKDNSRINFIGLSIYYLLDDDVYKMRLYLNDEELEIELPNNIMFNISNTSLLLSYGGLIFNQLQKYSNFSGEIDAVFVSEYVSGLNLDYLKYICNDYLEYNKNYINKGNPTLCNHTRINSDYLTSINDLLISTSVKSYPLISDYYSGVVGNIDNDELNVTESLITDEQGDGYFDFDEQLNTYVSKLLEKMETFLETTNSGEVNFKLNVSSINEVSRILKVSSDLVTFTVDLEEGQSSKYNIKLDDNTKINDLDYNKWYDVKFNFIYSNGKYTVKLITNGITISKDITASLNTEGYTVTLTRDKTYAHIALLFISSYVNHPLNDKVKLTTETKKFDELDRLVELVVKGDENEIIKNTYSYEQISSSTEIYDTYSINNEIITSSKGSLDLKYTYDDNGRLIEVKQNNEVYCSYEYNYLGYLSKYTKDSNSTNYTYDSNGNITNIGNKVLSYGNYDNLKSIVDGEYRFDITYFSNVLNPSQILKYKNDELIETTNITYEGNKIKEIEIIGDISITETYDYDLNGNRIKKVTITNNGASTSTKTSEYIYEDGVLIKEEKDGTTIFYLYDEQNKLYGFNCGKNYYYKRDIFQNIKGIIDDEGNEVVTYEYDPWGNILLETTTNETIKNLNSIKYKGYYYDTATELYWVSSRYYNAKIGRWLTTDDVEYIDQKTISGLNLYAYCLNDPIMYKDNSGHYPEWATFSNLFEGTSTALQLMLNGAYIGGYFSVVNAVRPNNIGIGTWNKQRTAAINSFKDDGKAFNKFGNIMAAITVAIQVGEGAFNDYNRGYSTDRIISNAVVNTTVYSLTTIGLAKFGGFVGSFIPIPIVGTAIGTAVGYLVGLGVNWLMELDVNGKSVIDHVRDFVYDSWKSLFD